MLKKAGVQRLSFNRLISSTPSSNIQPKFVANMKVLPMVPSGRDSLIALVVLWFMCVVVVGLRIYSRCRTSSIGADDVAAVFAVVGVSRGLESNRAYSHPY